MLITCANCGKGVGIEGPPGTPSKCACGNKLTAPSQHVKDQFGVATCTNCWKRYGVVGRPPGTRFKCKACGEIITIRDPGQKAPSPPAAAAPKARKKGAALAGKRRIDQLADTQDMDALPPGSARKAGGGAAAPVVSKAARQAAKELTELRASVQEFKAAAERNATAARQARSQLEEKEHQLEEKTAEIGRQAEEIRTLQERNSRQSTEISSLQDDMDQRSKEIDDLRGRVAGLEEDVKAREAERDERHAKIKELENELEARATREETEKFRSEKEEIEKRLEESGMKLSGMREAITQLKEPLAEALKRFDEMSTEAGSLKLPDFGEEFRKAKQDAKERASALVQLKKALDEESEAREGLDAECERLGGELAAARKAHEEFVKAAEDEIEHLASSATAAEERKGFLRGLFGGKKQPDTAERARTSRRLLKVAAARASEAQVQPEPVEDAEEVEEALPDVEDALPPGLPGTAGAAPEGDPEPVDYDVFDLPGGETEEVAEAIEVEEVEEAKEAEEEPPPPRKKKPRRGGKQQGKGKRRKG